MSLRIKKGTKVWGPKAPVTRRPGAPPSAPSSARPSVERLSQTPAPVSNPIEDIPVLDETQDDARQTTQPTTIERPQGAPQEEPATIRTVEAELGSKLKRKESTGEEQITASSPKRQKVDEQPHRLPTPPRNTITAAQTPDLPPIPVAEVNTTLPSSPIAEARQDVETSVYPDPELTLGFGPAGGLPHSIAGMPDGTGLGPAGDGYSTAAQIAQAPQIVQPPSDDLSRIQEPEDIAAVPIKRKKTSRRRKLQPPEHGDEDVTATLEMQLNTPRRIIRRGRKKKDANGGKRGATPEGAENEQINPSTMKMAELCKDIKIGLKSSNHDMIKQRLLEQKAKAKLAKANLQTPPVETADAISENPDLDASEASLVPSGPQMRIVNGQIVLAESSLHLDRHKRAEAENEDMVEVEENEFSHITTSGSYMKRERPQIWDASATRIFYQGLAQFGTNFEMIAKLFPHRNRRQIKLKFNNEEKKNPTRIDKILMGQPEKIDLENFEEMSGLKLEDVADIEKERQAIADEHEREVQAREKERTDADLQKKKDIADRSSTAKRLLASMDDAEEGSSGKENRVALNGDGIAEAMALAEQGMTAKGRGSKKSQGKPKKKKNPHGRGDGGDVVEVLGTVG